MDRAQAHPRTVLLRGHNLQTQNTRFLSYKEITNQKPTTIRQLYDVFKTPTYYLLDANKRIIAKNLTLQQFNDFLLNSKKK